MEAISLDMNKLTVLTVTTREGGLDMLAQCLLKQTFKDFEWIIVTNRLDFWTKRTKLVNKLTLIYDPPKREGDVNNQHKAWNAGIKHANGELIVSIVDLTWIPADCLQKLWTHYELNTKSCITCVGHQYDSEVDGRPEFEVWKDPRARTDLGSFYEVLAPEMELCVASFHKKAWEELGGFDEAYDQGVALGEKEFMARASKAGYTLYIDQTNEYRAIWHPRLSENHEENYQRNTQTYLKHIQEIVKGTRLKI